VEDFSDRYENVGLSGFNYVMFAPGRTQKSPEPFRLNCHVYSATLYNNSLECRPRTFNDDVDLCLQVLASGFCTVQVNAFLVQKIRTMIVKGGQGGNYDADGRLKLARSLERLWPHVVTTDRRWNRAQAVVRYNWRKFDTPLRLKPGLDPANLPVRDYGLELKQVKEIRSKDLRDYHEQANQNG
jgi:hypothetical protein